MDINLGNVPPIFAHDVALSSLTKSKKKDNGKTKKESFTELIFVDAVRKAAIARMVLPMSVLEELPKTIEDFLKKMKKDLKDKEEEENKPKDNDKDKDNKPETKTGSSYFG